MDILSTIIFLLGLVIAITIHEYAHAWTADHFGDPTPRAHGRVSLNPLRHLDPIGTLLLPLLTIISNLPIFGWGKPVPIDPYNLSKKEEIFVALAGAVSNFLLAIFCSLLVAFLSSSIFTDILEYFVKINLSLGIFNLLPIPPLDGSKVFLGLLPEESALQWEEAFNKYGIFLLALLLFLPIGGSNIISLIISPIISFLLHLLLPIH